jgi:DNA modification methylase
MQGEKAEMVWTDPPYGVGYDPTWRAIAGINNNRGKMGIVVNDDRADWTPAWELFTGDVVYVWHAGLHASEVQASLECCGFVMRSQIIWAKDRMALSRGDYHWQHEPCWYAVRKGQEGHRTADRSQTTLWQIPARDDSGHGHGTQKPLECMARPIRNHDYQIVYDPSCGSGTTMVACEQLDRKCGAIEISEPYCAVILQRMSEMNITPILLERTDDSNNDPMNT